MSRKSELVRVVVVASAASDNDDQGWSLGEGQKCSLDELPLSFGLYRARHKPRSPEIVSTFNTSQTPSVLTYETRTG